MNQPIESVYQTIGLGIYHSLPADGWWKAEFIVKIITRYMEARGFYLTDDNTAVSFGVEGMSVLNGFEQLRTLMARQHPDKGAWYTAVFHLTPDGKFHFEFDYDHLPAFTIIPDPDDWTDEFRQYPRPELEAQVPPQP